MKKISKLEKQILSTMISKNESIDTFTSNGLNIEDFISEKTRNVFKFIIERFNQGQPIGHATVNRKIDYYQDIKADYPLSEFEIEEAIKELKSIKDSPVKPDTNEFLPTEISDYIIKQEKTKGSFWEYVADKGRFYYFDNRGFWKIKKDEYIKKMIRNYLRKLNQKWDKKHKINEILSCLRSLLLTEDNHKLFDPGYNPDLSHINLQNGILNWQSGELKEHRPDFYSMFQLPFEYQPEASCELWNKSLKQWVPDCESRMFLQEFIGYCLIPDTSMQKAVILNGYGSNGKSTFLNVLSHLFGLDNLSNISLHRFTGNTGRWETANVQDKLVNICADIDSKYINETSILKKIISGDPIRGEYKHGSSFDFFPIVRMIFSANEIPTSRDRTHGWYRKFEIIQFPNTFNPGDDNFDPFLQDKLVKEIPGIFNWALKGLKRLKSQNNFTLSKIIKRSKNNYEKSNDNIKAFLSERTNILQDNYVVAKKVYKNYKHYCDEDGSKPTTRKKFTKRLKSLGISSEVKKVNGKCCRSYKGLKLLK